MTTQEPVVYTLVRKPVKTMRIRVKSPDGAVIVTAPRLVSAKTVDDFVQSKAAWVRKHQQRLAAQPTLEPIAPEDIEPLRKQVKAEATALIAYWADRMALPVPSLTVRQMKSRWGSCNPDKIKINLNLELGRHDAELLEYVVVHELAHLIVRGHDATFYRVMDKYLPDWRSRRARLNGRIV